MAATPEQSDEPDAANTIPAVNADTGKEAAIAAAPVNGEPTIVLTVVDEEQGAHSWATLPWELCALADLAVGRMTRLPRLSDMPNARESAPFDLVVGAIQRDEPPEIDTNEHPERMNQRRRAIVAMENGQPAFDLLLKLDIPPSILSAKTTIVGVPGNEVTATCLYWAAQLLRSSSEKVPKAMAAHIRQLRDG